MRPKSIAIFEWIFLTTFVMGGVRTWLEWEDLSKGASLEFSLGILIFTFSFMVALILLISRRRSRIAMWTLIVFHVAGLALLTMTSPENSLSNDGFLASVQAVMQTFAIVLLFLPSSRAWLDRAREESFEVSGH